MTGTKKNLYPAISLIIILGLSVSAWAADCPANSQRGADGYCYCEPGYHTSSEKQSCEPDCVPPMIYDPGLGICVCMEGYHWDEDLQRCASDANAACPENSYLSGGICLCNAGYYPDPLGVGCVKPVEQCPDHSSPSGVGCVCDPGYRFDQAGRICLPYQDTVSCPLGAELVGTQCVCQPPYEMQGDQCIYHTPCQPQDFIQEENDDISCIGGTQCAWEPAAGKCTDSVLTKINCEEEGYWDLEQNRCSCLPPVSIQGYFLDKNGRHLVCCKTGNVVLPDGRCAYR